MDAKFKAFSICGNLGISRTLAQHGDTPVPSPGDCGAQWLTLPACSVVTTSHRLESCAATTRGSRGAGYLYVDAFGFQQNHTTHETDQNWVFNDCHHDLQTRVDDRAPTCLVLSTTRRSRFGQHSLSDSRENACNSPPPHRSSHTLTLTP